MSTIKVSTISPLGTDATKTITIGSAGDTVAGAGANTPSFGTRLSGNQSVNSATTTLITFDTEDWDTDNAFSSNRFTVPTNEGGKYLFQAYIDMYFGNANGERIDVKLRINGSNAKEFRNVVNGDPGLTQSTGLSAILNLSAGDYVEVYVYHTYGSAQNVVAGNFTYFQGQKLIGV